MTEHSNIIGGSTAARRIYCPGSYALEKGLRKGPASEFAERGTALHEAMEDYLMNCEGEPIESLMGVEYNGFVMDEELINTKLKPALKAFYEVIQAAGGDLEYFVEAKVSLGDVIKGAFGTVDVLGKGADGRLWVIDWKFGDGVPVSPKENYQMAFYAACALLDPDPEIAELVGNEALDIVFVIVQPRVGYPGENDFYMWETTDEWVNAFIDQLEIAYSKMTLPNAPFATGAHCQWCGGQTVGEKGPACPLKRGNVVKVIENKVEPATMDAITIATWLDKAEEVAEFIKNLKTHAHYEAERGLKIPGWKVVDKRGKRQYTDTKKATATLVRALNTADAHEPRKLISPAIAEKKLGQDRYTKLLAKHVETVSSGTTLARDTDKRPDVSDSSKGLGNKLRESLAADKLPAEAQIKN